MLVQPLFVNSIYLSRQMKSKHTTPPPPHIISDKRGVTSIFSVSRHASSKIIEKMRLSRSILFPTFQVGWWEELDRPGLLSSHQISPSVSSEEMKITKFGLDLIFVSNACIIILACLIKMS